MTTTYYKNGQTTTNPVIPNVINPTTETILENGWYIYIDIPPTYNPDEYKIERAEVTIQGNDAIQNYAIIALTPEEIRERTVPQSITQLQGKLQLDLMGLYGQVEAMIEQSGNQAKIYWNTAANWDRDSPILNNLAPLVWPEDTQDNLDEFFKQAIKLN
jgi:hypothetical protein